MEELKDLNYQPEIFENSVVTLKTFGYNFELICESVIDGYEAGATVYASETAPVSPQTSSFILARHRSFSRPVKQW